MVAPVILPPLTTRQLPPQLTVGTVSFLSKSAHNNMEMKRGPKVLEAPTIP